MQCWTQEVQENSVMRQSHCQPLVSSSRFSSASFCIYFSPVLLQVLLRMLQVLLRRLLPAATPTAGRAMDTKITSATTEAVPDRKLAAATAITANLRCVQKIDPLYFFVYLE